MGGTWSSHRGAGRGRQLWAQKRLVEQLLDRESFQPLAYEVKFILYLSVLDDDNWCYSDVHSELYWHDHRVNSM